MLAGKCGAAVALNPQTGEVYAMASSPTYDPNLVEKTGGYAKIQATKAPCRPSAPLLNRATQGLYPPGSTFKTITAAAALDSGDFTPDSTVPRPGLLHRVRQAGLNAARPERPRRSATSPSPRPTSTRSTRSSARSGRSSAPGKILDQAKKFGFYYLPPLETPADARSPSGLYNAATRKPFDPKNPTPRSTRAGSPSARSGCS